MEKIYPCAFTFLIFLPLRGYFFNLFFSPLTFSMNLRFQFPSFLPALYGKLRLQLWLRLWQMANKQININYMQQLSRLYRTPNPEFCVIPSSSSGETIDHLFLHCPRTLGSWHRLFALFGAVQIPPRSLVDVRVRSPSRDFEDLIGVRFSEEWSPHGDLLCWIIFNLSFQLENPSQISISRNFLDMEE